MVKDNRLAQRTDMIYRRNMLMVEPLNDNEPPTTTADDWEVNPGDKYSQLGDAAATCVLDVTVRALKFTETNVVVV